MFVSTRDAGGRHRSKSYAINTTAKSSKTSLSSVLTVGSAGSGDSGSTVTQSSYDHSQHKRRKRSKQRRHRTNESVKERENKKKSVDVFDFLVEKHASEVTPPLIAQPATNSVKNIVEYESTEVEELEQLEDSRGLHESGEPDEADESDELEELGELEASEEVGELQEHEEHEALVEAERLMDPQGPNELEGPSELINPDELVDILRHVESSTESSGDSEKDQDAQDYHGQYEYDEDDHGDDEHDEGNDGSDESDKSDGQSNINESDEESFAPSIVVHKEYSDPEVYYRSMSDSGISMGSCSIDASITSLPPRLPMLPEEPSSRSSSRPRYGNELAVVDPRWTWNTSPGPFHESFIPPPAPVPPPMVYEMPMYASYPPYTPYGTPPPMPEDEIRGPAIRIREPSHLETKPKCFRSFTKMSARLILRLQDDIAELEGELSVLDGALDAIEAESSSDDEAFHQRSNDKHMLKAREFEIYQELQGKLGHYSSSLESMQKIENMSQPAVKSDLMKHHRWLESRVSPPYKARHLVGNDLRILSSTTRPNESVAPAPAPVLASSSSSVSINRDTQFMAYSALINTLLPLVAFKMVSSVLNRLILLIVIVIVGVTVQDRTRTTIKAEDMNCILVCVGISVFAAFFL